MVASTSASFNPAHGGTPDAAWRRALRRVPTWLPDSQHVLVVSPHPDDEVLGVGGLIGTLSRQGVDVTVVSVTDGEHAYAGMPGLAATRRTELRRALDLLAPRAEVIHLGLPDGAVAQHEPALQRALRRLQRSDSLLIAPYEWDGHPDHEAAARAALSLGSSVVRYPIWFWHRAIPSRLPPMNLRRFALPLVMQRAKARAMQAFRSQLAPPGRAPILPDSVLDYFHRPYETLVCS